MRDAASEQPVADAPTVHEVAGYVLAEELGEPPGALIDNVQPDVRGITWWNGNDPAWRDYRRYS